MGRKGSSRLAKFGEVWGPFAEYQTNKQTSTRSYRQPQDGECDRASSWELQAGLWTGLRGEDTMRMKIFATGRLPSGRDVDQSFHSAGFAVPNESAGNRHRCALAVAWPPATSPQPEVQDRWLKTTRRLSAFSLLQIRCF